MKLRLPLPIAGPHCPNYLPYRSHLLGTTIHCWCWKYLPVFIICGIWTIKVQKSAWFFTSNKFLNPTLLENVSQDVYTVIGLLEKSDKPLMNSFKSQASPFSEVLVLNLKLWEFYFQPYSEPTKRVWTVWRIDVFFMYSSTSTTGMLASDTWLFQLH